MKYYAVTEDPNELFHYGRLGMKWGQHIFGDKPKSPGYKKALGKLRAASKNTKSAIQKSATQHAMNRQKRQQNKYNQAVKKAQRNIELVENLKKLDQVRVNERGLDRDYWGAAKVARIHDRQQRKMDKINNKRAIKQFKQEVKNNRNELKMDKIAEKARQGKLKYGQLSDEQIQRLTQRLTMERNARQLGSAEKTWRQQKKEAFRQGKLQGITKGTAAAMEEIARAGTIYGISKLKNRRKLNAAAKQEGKEERIKSRAKNKKTRRDIRKETKQELKQEIYKQNSRAGKKLQRIKEDNAERQFKIEERHRALQTERQNRQNLERDEAELKQRAELAYKYGYLTSGGNNKGGGNNGGKKGNNDTDITALSNYFNMRYVKGETVQQQEARAKKDVEKAKKQEQNVIAAERRRENLDKFASSVGGKVHNARSRVSSVIDRFDNAEYREELNAKAYAKQQIREQKEAAKEAQKAAQKAARKQAKTVVINDQRDPNKTRRPEAKYTPDQDDYVPMYTNDPPKDGKVKSGPWGAYDAWERDQHGNGRRR